MSSYKAKALIIRGYNLGEYDKILKMYSQTHGLLTGVAKGSRRPKSRFGARINLFNLVDLEMARGRSLDIITQAEIISCFKNIPSDFNKFVFCQLIAKIVLKTQTEASEPCKEVFKLMYICFREIDACSGQADTLKKIMCFFIAKFLSVTGFGPLLKSCSRCNRILEPGNGAKKAISISMGGLLCPDCLPGAGPVTRLSGRSYNFISSLFNLKLEQVREVDATPYALGQAYRFLESYIVHHTDCSLESFKYLKKIGI